MEQLSTNIEEILSNFTSLKYEDKEYLFSVISKRMIEERRRQIKQNGVEAERDYHEGRAKVGTVEELWNDLND